MFAYGNNVTAANLADAMVAAGVKQAVALDMNLTWPTGYYYTREDGQVVGHRIHLEIMREPSTYWTRSRRTLSSPIRSCRCPTRCHRQLNDRGLGCRQFCGCVEPIGLVQP